MIPDYLVISTKFAWQGPWNIALYSSHLHICISLETKQTVKRKLLKVSKFRYKDMNRYFIEEKFIMKL